MPEVPSWHTSEVPRCARLSLRSPSSVARSVDTSVAQYKSSDQQAQSKKDQYAEYDEIRGPAVRLRFGREEMVKRRMVE